MFVESVAANRNRSVVAYRIFPFSGEVRSQAGIGAATGSALKMPARFDLCSGEHQNRGFLGHSNPNSKPSGSVNRITPLHAVFQK
jgi:hypothetical protein